MPILATAVNSGYGWMSVHNVTVKQNTTSSDEQVGTNVADPLLPTEELSKA